MSISPTVDVLSAELLEEQAVPMNRCENAGQPDDVAVVVGYADDDEDDEDDEEGDVDDLDDDDDDEEEEEDDEEDKEEGEEKEDE